jgi:hypothetical protein
MTETINALDVFPGDVIIWNSKPFIVIAIREKEREYAPRLRFITTIDPKTSTISSFFAGISWNFCVMIRGADANNLHKHKAG